MMRKTLALTALAGTLAAFAPNLASAQVYVRVGPPAPVYERRGPVPGPGYVWHGGYHRWDGGRYVWVPGSYVVAPRPRAYWVPGAWVRTPRGWYWREGYWR
ncbi:hypothetical protein [Terriglobus aquaticus]|uniref:YXWGXW repeat-containing protein n=1 Tax=Terriglobus aquaticus TaxID=940139 RepID=A0ABW9KG63_9BACT|nr:hypothetical protein [Terriglobus aquaticus]